MPDPLRVLIVDDSRLFRAALQRALERLDNVKVVGSVWDGAKAIAFLQGHPVDLVTLDVEMPTMDGLATLREINRLAAAGSLSTPVGCLLVSAFTERGARITIEGLELGAFDFIAKPAAASADDAVTRLSDELALKIKGFRLRRQLTAAPAPVSAPPRSSATAEPSMPPAALASRVLRAPRAICIAASTGGPQALATLLPALAVASTIPILIVQHMPVGFTAFLAESLARRAPRPVREARDHEPIAPGGIYLAPGGRHLLVRAGGDGGTELLLNEQPPVNGCRPSGDVLLRSVAAVFGAQSVGIVLTGMGQDGAQGLLALRRAGGVTIAQDEATSVVWGMPGHAVQLGAAEQVLPLREIPAAVAAVLGSARTPLP